MTTGLQRVRIRHHRLRTTEPGSRVAAVVRLVALRFRRATSWAGSSLATPAVRPAHDIRRGVRAGASTGARDLHDAAVLGGVVPPRM